MKFILRLFPEISIKSKSVRNRLIKLLQHNIINATKHHGIETHIHSQWDKLIVTVADNLADTELKNKVVAQLKLIPGIHSFMQVEEFEFISFEDVYQKVKAVYEHKLENNTFAVRVRRRGKHEFNSQQAERQIGGMLKQGTQNKGVSLSNPNVLINLEIDSNKVFLITDKYQGLGGFPVSSQGEVLSLISGGYDSGVAAYRAIRRGMKVHYLFFNMGGNVHELGVKQVSYFLWDKFASSHRVKFITIPFERIVGEILEKTHHGVRGVILKRMMVRVASAMAKKMDIEAIVTGEAVGQVSSQTLINLSHIDRASQSLVLRPLIMSDKQDIIDEASAIGTSLFAENMPEFCGVISDHPNVCPKASFVEEQEALMSQDLVEDAVLHSKLMDIKDIPHDTKRLEQDIETVSTLNHNDIVLDVRAPDEVLNQPLTIEATVINMPFYKVISNFASLDNTKVYAFYCAQGVMSGMLARQLKELGYHNVKILRLDS